MPKAYSEQEKAYIRRRLHEEAADCMARYGIRRTTVDELVRRVNIPKGTFYLFYASKELLLYEVLMEEHARLEAEMLQRAQSLRGREADVDAVTELLVSYYKMPEERPVLKALSSSEVELLARKLPHEMFQAHLAEDEDSVTALFSPYLQAGGERAAVYGAAFRGIYFATLHKREIGEACYDEALRLLLRGLVSQLLEEAAQRENGEEEDKRTEEEK